MLDTLTTLVQPWADLYAENTVLSTSVITLHVVAMFVGGGLAIAADRQVLRLARHDPAGQRVVLGELAALHGLVIGALALTVLSGMGLFASDVETFVASPVYWTKMAAFVILLANGVRLRGAESRLLSAGDRGADAAALATLNFSAGVSLAAWILIVLLGVVLGNV